MTNEIAETQPKSRLRKVGRVALIVCATIAVALTIAHFAWKYSGTGEWVQVIDQNGIKVYARKASGSTLRDIKGVRRVKTRLMTAMAAMTEEGADNCAEWLPGCESSKNIVPYNRRDLTSSDLYVVRYPSPYAPREFLLRTQVSQDLKSKAVLMDLKAVPDLVPRHKCCYRIADMDNRWLFTPLQSGDLQVEFSMHMDQGLPYVLVNRISPRLIYRMLEDLPRHFDKKQFQEAKLDYIQE